MNRFPFVCGLALVSAAVALAADDVVRTFRKIQATPQFWAEGAYAADFNRDGKMDLVYGPFWFEGPGFTKRHEYAPATTSFKLKKSDGSEETIPGFEGGLGVNNAYSKNFLTFAYDINGDGWPDVLVLGFPGEESFWFENPKGREGHWERHVALDVTDNESPTFLDITGDGRPEIVCSSRGFLGYAEIGKDPTKPWTFHPISPKGEWQRFTHGLGVGDVNGDGRMDLLEKNGWWEQPASLDGEPVWKLHKFPFSEAGGAQMLVYDVNGDGANDVITSLAAHGYGLAWFENVKENGEITFKRHMILNKDASENKYGIHFSQMHSIDLVDMDGDGIKDLVTGKRFWAHGSQGDVEPNAPAVLYWFKVVRGADKSVDFIPYLIDSDSGVGTQVAAIDVNGDGLPDVVVGNKKGTFVFLQEARKVGRAEWEKAQPKVYQATDKP